MKNIMRRNISSHYMYVYLVVMYYCERGCMFVYTNTLS